MTFDIIALSRIITVCRLAAGEHTNKKLAEGQQVTGDSKLRQETATKQRASCSGRGKILQSPEGERPDLQRKNYINL